MTDRFSNRPLRAFQRPSGVTWDRILQVFELAAVAVPDPESSGPLSPAVASVLQRLESVYASALSLHEGHKDDAREWLEAPRPALGHRCPLDCAATEDGVQQAVDLVGRIEHGIVS